MALFKDFNKDVKDLLNKNYSEAGAWKIESKFKGPKDSVFVNPQATGKGVTLDVEYIPSQCGAKVKLNVTPSLDAKLTTTYTEKGHKVEVVTDKNLAYEVVYEGKVDKVSINEKLTSKAIDSGVSVAVAPHCQVGAGVTYGLKDKALSWTLGAQYSDAGKLVSIVTQQLKSYTTGLLVPVTLGSQKVNVGAQVVCGGGAFSGAVGVETGCVLCKGNSIRVKVDTGKKWAVAYIAKLADNWKAAITVDGALKPGVLITRE